MSFLGMRKWHRSMGMVLALFIIFQVGSGLVLTISEFSPKSVYTSEGHAHVEHDNQDSAWHSAMGWMHHNTSSWMGVYRTLLGLGILVQTVLGVMIFLKTKHRVKSEKP